MLVAICSGPIAQQGELPKRRMPNRWCKCPSALHGHKFKVSGGPPQEHRLPPSWDSAVLWDFVVSQLQPVDGERE